jgi:hypothetical protein
MPRALIALILLVMCAQNAFAGAWTLPKYKVWGENYMKWDYAKETYDANWKRGQAGRGSDGRNWGFTMVPRLEYGVADWANFIWRMPYKQYYYKEYGRPPAWGTFVYKNHGITSVDIGGKIRIFEKPFVLSVQELTWINVNGYGIYHGSDAGPFYNQPGLGDGEDTVDLRVIASKKWDVGMSFIKEGFKLPVYLSGETGYQWKNRNVCDAWVYFIEGGFWPINWLLLKSELDGYKSHDGTGSRAEKAYGILRFGFVWEVFGGDSILRKGNKLFNLEFDYGMTIWGKNTTAYDEYVFKVQAQF